MEQIKDIIHDVIERLSSKNLEPNQKIQQAWQEAVGKKLIKHTRLEGVKNGKLLVKLDSPVLMFHLNLKRNHILKELRKIDKEVTDIDLRIGKVQ